MCKPAKATSSTGVLFALTLLVKVLGFVLLALLRVAELMLALTVGAMIWVMPRTGRFIQSIGRAIMASIRPVSPVIYKGEPVWRRAITDKNDDFYWSEINAKLRMKKSASK